MPVRLEIAEKAHICSKRKGLTSALQRLFIMEIHGTLVEFFHYTQYLSSRTGGNQQTTGKAIGLNQLHAIRAGLPN